MPAFHSIAFNQPELPKLGSSREVDAIYDPDPFLSYKHHLNISSITVKVYTIYLWALSKKKKGGGGVNYLQFYALYVLE